MYNSISSHRCFRLDRQFFLCFFFIIVFFLSHYALAQCMLVKGMGMLKE